MRNKLSLFVFILSIPVILVATFVLFWVTVALAMVEFIIALPLTWFGVADSKFSPEEEESINKKNQNEKVKTLVPKQEAG